MGNQFNTYVWNDGSRDVNYWDKLQAYNDWAQYSPAYGFMWDSSNYSTQMTALQNALSTYRPALESGAVGVAGVEETLQKLNDALYAAGLQEVMDAKQEQLDQWLDEMVELQRHLRRIWTPLQQQKKQTTKHHA